MNASERAALWIIAVGVLVAGMWVLREPLTQFALAVILFLAIDGLARAIGRRVRFLPLPLSLPIAVILVLGVTAMIVVVVAQNISGMAANAKDYETHLNQLVQQAYQLFHIQGPPPTVGDLVARVNPAQFLSGAGGAVQNALSNTIFILIFLGFLFPSARIVSLKLDAIFTDEDQRRRVRAIISSIRYSMERYMWVQTVASVVDTILTFISLQLIGLDNALFWAFLIFFLNYIPTIGSIIAVVLPTAIALMQFQDLGHVVAVAFGVGIWQFVIGNFIQPRMTGQSLNLSTTIVLLALAIWGTIWGVAGAFLAAPLTVMLMIVLAQFPETKWIAIMLSADGRPTLAAPTIDKSDSASI